MQNPSGANINKYVTLLIPARTTYFVIVMLKIANAVGRYIKLLMYLKMASEKSEITPQTDRCR